MEPVAFLNGEFMHLSELKISPLDRGFLFGDGVYESIPVYNKKPRNLELHLKRLKSSLERILIDVQEIHLEKIIFELIGINDFEHQYIYLQITRGSNGLKRSHLFPELAKATVFAISQPIDLPGNGSLEKGYKAVVANDTRWNCGSIKTVNLLPNVLQLNECVKAKADEAILIHDGKVIEGTCSNFFMVKNGVIVTPMECERMLSGITRKVLINLSKENNIPLIERIILEAELQEAEEIWFTNSVVGLLPIVTVDNKLVGDGKVGKICRAMFKHYLHYVL